MLNFLRAKLGTKFVPIMIVLFLVLAGSTATMTRLYMGKVKENSLLSEKLKANKLAYEALEAKLLAERSASQRARQSEKNIQQRYKGLRDELETIQSDATVPGLNSRDVANVLCANGLAEPAACAAALAP